MPLPEANLVRRRALQYVADLVHLSPDVVADIIRTFYKFHQQELAKAERAAARKARASLIDAERAAVKGIPSARR